MNTFIKTCLPEALRRRLPGWLFSGGHATARAILYPAALVVIAALVFLGFMWKPAPDDATLLSGADVLVRAGALDAAEESARAVLGHDPKNLDALLILGAVEEKRGHEKSALDLYRKSLVVVDDEDVARDIELSVADLHRRLGQNDECTEMLASIESKRGTLWQVERMRGVLAREAGDLEGALERFVRMGELADDPTEATLRQVSCLIGLNRWDEAEERLRSLDDPAARGTKSAWVALARVRAEANDVDGARRALDVLLGTGVKAKEELLRDSFWQKASEDPSYMDLLE